MLAATSHARDFHWELPPGFEEPRVPADNPMSAAKVALGRVLRFATIPEVLDNYERLAADPSADRCPQRAPLTTAERSAIAAFLRSLDTY